MRCEASGGLTKRAATVTVYVGDKERQFRIGASSVVRHLELAFLREAIPALPSVRTASETLRFWAESHKDAIVLLLSEPIDGLGPLTDREFWELEPYDVPRILRIEASLTNVSGMLQAGEEGSPKSLDSIADSWREMGVTIARAKLAPDPFIPLNKWSLEQCVKTYRLACRELWRETALQVRLAGADPGNEPDFCDERKQQISAERQAFIDRDFEEMKKRYREKNLTPDGRKFPGTL